LLPEAAEIEVMLTPKISWKVLDFLEGAWKVLARQPDIRVNELNKAFLLPFQRVASCCEGICRNISKQKTFVGSSESEAKGQHGYGITEYSCR
jgi:hypothetical protein